MIRSYLHIVSFLLVGYLLFGRSFAYVGYPPIYIGEIVLTLGIVVLFLRNNWYQLIRVRSIKLLVIFMIWCAYCTIPYISSYGIDALRDAATWGYGMYAILTAALAFNTDLLLNIQSWYRRWISIFLFWTPCALLLVLFAAESIPPAPWIEGSNVLLVNPKGGDIAVHLAGALTFFTIFSHRNTNHYRNTFITLGWVTSFFLVGFTGRSAFLTLSFSAFFLAINISPRRWIKWATIVFLFISLIFIAEVEIDVGVGRPISFKQLDTNIRSIFTKVEGFSGEGSKEWRLAWWSTIIDYTIFGEYFWSGKGFGINLADDDGFQVHADHSLRSPHNGHLTILARTGVPGFSLWIAMQLSFMLSLWKAYKRLANYGYQEGAKFALWVLAYWFAFIINGAFDVFLEGPQGGIWFWCIFGLGNVIVYFQITLINELDKTSQVMVIGY